MSNTKWLKMKSQTNATKQRGPMVLWDLQRNRVLFDQK